MASRWTVAAVVVALSAAIALPALAHDDEEWDDRDDGSLRQRHHRHHSEQVIIPNGNASGATRPYWGTTQPYWGTMQPYWGPSNAPPQPQGLTPLNRRGK